MEYQPIPDDLKEESVKYRSRMIEQLADFDDNLAEKFLNDEPIAEEEIKKTARKACLDLKITPVFMGSAFKNKGVQLCLDAVIDYLPNPEQVSSEALDLEDKEAPVSLSVDEEKPFVGLAFKLEDGRFGQLTYMRIYQGSIGKGDFMINSRTGKKVKVPRLVYMHADDMEDIEKAAAGDIVAFFGIDCASGDTFCDGKVHYTMTSMFIPEPVMSLAVAPKQRAESANFSKALQKFRKEDPTFFVHRDEESAQTIISGMGELHLNVYIERMKREFSCEVQTGQPQVAYRETIGQKTEFDYTHKKQTGGAGAVCQSCGFFRAFGSKFIPKL